MDDVRTILIVDDEPHMVRVLAVVLRDAGYRVVATDDPAEAMQIAERGDATLVTVDGHVAGARDLVAGLARNVRTHAIPVIVLTEAPIEESAASFANVRALLRRPLSPRGLLEVVAACVDSAAHRDERRMDAA
ncbi:MAG: response regulator [Phycisphaerae bacterium]|nr:response regulator [Phycisphaerae bacterium]